MIHCLSCVAGQGSNVVSRKLNRFIIIRLKHWRVNRLIRHKANHLSMFRLLWPCSLLAVIVISMLSYWTSTGDYAWERQEIDSVTGESVGQCMSTLADIAPLHCAAVTLLLIPVCLSGVMAYKTLGIDDLYSESKWVLIFILVQFQVRIMSMS